MSQSSSYTESFDSLVIILFNRIKHLWVALEPWDRYCSLLFLVPYNIQSSEVRILPYAMRQRPSYGINPDYHKPAVEYKKSIGSPRTTGQELFSLF